MVQGIEKLNCKTTRKIEMVKKLDNNPDEFSQFELEILDRFRKEAFDNKISCRHFWSLIYTDFIQEYESILEKTADIRQMQKEKEHDFEKIS